MKRLLRRLFKQKHANGGHIGNPAEDDSIPIVLRER